MTYNEWRDELKNNLLSVSEAERKRVLDYYGEAYADRREAGFTEREIIADFGAPYDAAQRILYGDDGGNFEQSPRYRYEESRPDPRNSARRPEHYDDRRSGYYQDDYYQREREPLPPLAREPQPQAQPQPQPQPQNSAATAKKSGNLTWVYVILCIRFAIPIFVVVVTMVGITIGLCVAPFGLFGGGIARVFAGIGIAISNVPAGFVQMGLGLVYVGVGLALIPLCVWLVKMMWKLFKMFFAWLKELFSGKEGV